ncbi:MAG TPA: DUF4276 family protein [Longimicrobium sp.]|nr:DUF4276 family protein [Longimicrobium sp.]
MRVIHIYVEGGGEASNGRSRLREGLTRFLAELRTDARRAGHELRVVPSGSRTEAYSNFLRAVEQRPDALTLLLVDAERSVLSLPRAHLSSAAGEDNWNLSAAEESQVHLMAQVMESWFLADPETLSSYYGQGFAAGSLPRTRNVEEIPKNRVEAALDSATRRTMKGRYHKMNHGPAILELLNPDLVRSRAPHCDRLFGTILDYLSAS